MDQDGIGQMGTEIAIANSREIARAAMSWPFDPEAIAPQVDRAAVEQALEGYRLALKPAKDRKDDDVIEDQRTLVKLIGKIGNRIRPDFNDQQAKKWASEVVDALSDQPTRAAIAAAKEAHHFPFRFPGEVHSIILEKCRPHATAYRNAMRNLERLLREIDNPTKRMEKQEPEPMTDEDLQSLSEPLRLMGIGAGWLIDDGGKIRWATDAEQAEHQRAIARARKADRS